MPPKLSGKRSSFVIFWERSAFRDLTTSLIHEFKDPWQRKFDSFIYYVFAGGESEAVAGEDNVALVLIKKDGTVARTARYAAFQIASMLADQEQIVSTESSDAALEAMSTCTENESVMAVINNHTDTAKDVELNFCHLPFAPEKTTATLQRIDESHSNDGNGLESGESLSPISSPQGIGLNYSLGPYATILITLKKM